MDSLTNSQTASLLKYKALRQRLWTMRNGVVADALRRGGCPCRLIWGVNIPQLVEIAASVEKDERQTVVKNLLDDKDLRESFILAAMLLEPEQLSSIDDALDFCKNLRWAEDADLASHRIFRHLSFAPYLAERLCDETDDLLKYCGLRLWLNLIGTHGTEALCAAEKILNNPVASLHLRSIALAIKNSLEE